MLNRHGLFVFAALWCVLLSSPATALMLELSTEKLTRDAELIITGDVEDTECQWTSDQKAIMTKAEISITEIIKGRAVDRRIQVMHMGGQIGDIGMMVSDEAPLRRGERVLLFLSRENKFSGGSAYGITGRAQGKYTIGDDHIARKRGFSTAFGDEQMDRTVHMDTLKEKIRTYADDK